MSECIPWRTEAERLYEILLSRPNALLDAHMKWCAAQPAWWKHERRAERTAIRRKIGSLPWREQFARIATVFGPLIEEATLGRDESDCRTPAEQALKMIRSDIVDNLAWDAARQWARTKRRYLRSQAWQEKRRAVHRRSGGVCEDCGRHPVTQIYHVSYDRIGDELLVDLLGLCGPCHRERHVKT